MFCRILRWLTDEEEHLKENNQPGIKFLIIEMSRKPFSQTIPVIPSRNCSDQNADDMETVAAVTDIDTSGIHALEELHRALEKKDISVYIHIPLGLGTSTFLRTPAKTVNLSLFCFLVISCSWHWRIPGRL